MLTEFEQFVAIEVCTHSYIHLSPSNKRDSKVQLPLVMSPQVQVGCLL